MKYYIVIIPALKFTGSLFWHRNTCICFLPTRKKWNQFQPWLLQNMATDWKMSMTNRTAFMYALDMCSLNFIDEMESLEWKRICVETLDISQGGLIWIVPCTRSGLFEGLHTCLMEHQAECISHRTKILNTLCMYRRCRISVKHYPCDCKTTCLVLHGMIV